ncbi:MAG TPA: LPXTG cell wall anchor domain-containing protein, partial [Anaerolineaceae bacterium]|nr:LPXTG cell wall anchor domain-containing protein [Anaerolineaceae bacterium]
NTPTDPPDNTPILPDPTHTIPPTATFSVPNTGRENNYLELGLFIMGLAALGSGLALFRLLRKETENHRNQPPN